MNALGLLIRGLLAGVAIAAPVGPVNILCISRTISKSWRSGLFSGLGAAAADTFYGSIAGFSISLVIQFLIREEFWVRLFGGILLIAIGVLYFFKRPHALKENRNQGAHSDFVSTFLLTLTNPTTVLSFLAVLAALGMGHHHVWWRTVFLVAGIFCGSMFWWIFLTSLAHRFRDRFNETAMLWMNRIAGLAIGAFGVLTLLLAWLAGGTVRAADSATMESRYAPADFALTADPGARPWKNMSGVFAENDPHGKPVAGHRTEIRSRWTRRNIYFLFVCLYGELNLKPNPSRDVETNQLWDWDVAEVFVGTDFERIARYKEFEISPQGEWVDLDIDREHPKPEGGWLWNSGFASKARIDRQHKIWYGEMRIPLSAIDQRPPAAGLSMRINFYRCQGRAPRRKYIAWQPTQSNSFHVPEAFGVLRLGE